jgi:dipeptidase E
MKIVAIGGGDMGAGETLALDQEIVSLTGKSAPNALFLPTASFDSPDYWERFQAIYRAALGCSTDVLFLWDGYAPEEIENTIQATKRNQHPHTWEFRGSLERARGAIASADLIYVGGGNTRRMIELWKSAGIDLMIREAADRGAVLAGLSAGCICWGRYGNSDAAMTEDLGKPTMRIDGLDYIPFALCPHMSREGFRLEEFKAMMRETPGTGIGMDDCCALVVVNDRYRIVACIDGAVAHRVTAESHEILEPMAQFSSLSNLT